MRQSPFTDEITVPATDLATRIARLLQAGDVTRLQVISPTGSLTLVLPLTPDGDRIADRWAPVVEALSRLYPTLALRIARSAKRSLLGDVAAIDQMVAAGDEGRPG